MTKYENILNEPVLDFGNWNLILEFVSDFDIRISDFLH